MSLADLSVKNPVLVNIFMIIVFVAGFYTTATIPKEEMPNIDLGIFEISVAYSGVSPEQIEKEVLIPIEEELADLHDLRCMESVAEEGFAFIEVETDTYADIDATEDAILRIVNRIRDLPEGASDIYVKRINMAEVNPICSVSFSGPYNENGLREIAKDLKDRISRVENITKIDITGTRDREIKIKIDTDKLEYHDVSISDIESIIASRSRNVAGGGVRHNNDEYLLRSMGTYNEVEEVAQTVIRTDIEGNTLRIMDVAVVSDTLEDSKTISRINTKTGVSLTIYKREEGNIISVMKEVREVIADFNKAVPDLKIEIRNDDTIVVNRSLKTLASNSILGIILVFIVLWMFIGWKNALFAAWGLPFSFLLTFVIMQFYGITINNLSFFALILVLGMIVDDAIIVIENVQRYLEKGYSVKEATLKGTKEIMWPVISAVSTTISAFLPLLIMKGHMGEFLKLFPIVVIIALAASLLECLLILPCHIVELGGTKKAKSSKGANKLTMYLVSKYERGIVWALRHRKSVILMLIAGMALSVFLLTSGAILIEFFPEQYSTTIIMNLKLKPGTAITHTESIIDNIESHIIHMEQNDDVVALVTNIGQLEEDERIITNTNFAEIKIDVVEEEFMKYSHDHLKAKIGEYVKTIEDVESFTFRAGGTEGPPVGDDIELRISGKDMAVFREISDRMVKHLEDIPGVIEIQSSLARGKSEIRIYPDWEKLKLYGISDETIHNIVRIASYGMDIGSFNTIDNKVIDIRLESEKKQDICLEEIYNLTVPTDTGNTIKLSAVADFVITSGYSVIEHYDRNRFFSIIASVKDYVKDGKEYSQSSDTVNDMLMSNAGTKGSLFNIIEDYPGYTLEFGGEVEEEEETFESLYISLVIAMLLIYAILGTQFKSYVQPLIVMMTIPFAICGVIFGLAITRLPFSLMTMISFVTLCGIVVNDSLVLVDFVNKSRAEGHDRWRSLIEAGKVRLRPIVMTSVTTIAGFVPMIISTTAAANDYKPMAVAIAFGLAFSTFLTLFAIPVVYSIIDSFFGKLGLTRFKENISLEESLKNLADSDADYKEII